MLTPLILCSCSCKLWIHSTQTIHSQCSDNHDSFNAAAYTYRYIINFSHLIGVRSLSSAVLAQFWRDLKTHLFEWHCVSFSALAVFSRNALYKSTFYLLTYLLIHSMQGRYTALFTAVTSSDEFIRYTALSLYVYLSVYLSCLSLSLNREWNSFQLDIGALHLIYI